MTNSGVVANFMRSCLYFSIYSVCYGVLFTQVQLHINRCFQKTASITNTVVFNHFYEYDSLNSVSVGSDCVCHSSDWISRA